MNPISLFELNNLIKATLDTFLEPSYWVIAEIGELRVNPKGHCYTELIEKEGDVIHAKIRGNIWSYSYGVIRQKFEQVTGTSLRAGLKVLCQVSVQYHELYGMSLHIKDIDPNFTLGERAMRKQAILEQLTQANLIDLNKQLPLPLVPQRIAIISSATAAGFGDFLDQLANNRNHYFFQTTLYQAAMQGDEAPQSIMNALEKIKQRADQFDLVVIIRGGGAQVDLDCFDHFELASKVAQTPLPVITGIGHERDETIVDLVAHTKMKTPTAVAEFILEGMRRFEEQLDDAAEMLERWAGQLIQTATQDLRELRYQLQTHTKEVIYQQKELISRVQVNLEKIQDKRISNENALVDRQLEQLKKVSQRALKTASEQWIQLERQIELINPENVLKRGYSITLHEGKVIKKDSKLKIGDQLTTIIYQKTIESKVEKP